MGPRDNVIERLASSTRMPVTTHRCNLIWLSPPRAKRVKDMYVGKNPSRQPPQEGWLSPHPVTHIPKTHVWHTVRTNHVSDCWHLLLIKCVQYARWFRTYRVKFHNNNVIVSRIIFIVQIENLLQFQLLPINPLLSKLSKRNYFVANNIYLQNANAN